MSSNLTQIGSAVHGLFLATAASSTPTTTTAPRSSSSSAFLLIILAFAAIYFLVLRPRNKRMRASQQSQGGAAVGDEVMLTSGIIGRVMEIDGDRASVEIAPDIEIEVVRRAISQVLVKAEDEVVEVGDDPGAAPTYGLDADEYGPAADVAAATEDLPGDAGGMPAISPAEDDDVEGQSS